MARERPSHAGSGSGPPPSPGSSPRPRAGSKRDLPVPAERSLDRPREPCYSVAKDTGACTLLNGRSPSKFNRFCMNQSRNHQDGVAQMARISRWLTLLALIIGAGLPAHAALLVGPVPDPANDLALPFLSASRVEKGLQPSSHLADLLDRPADRLRRPIQVQDQTLPQSVG
jgi:hypothetical protein